MKITITIDIDNDSVNVTTKSIKRVTPPKEGEKVMAKTVEKTCMDCGNAFIATGKEIAKRKRCDNCREVRSIVKKPPVSTSTTTKACEKCGQDMPLTSMYKECANCRPTKTPAPKPPCKLCVKYGRLCKRHRNGPVKTVVEPAFLPGHEKSAAELEQIKKRYPETMPKHNPSRTAAINLDDDPWNCAVCRGLGKRCRLHYEMEKEGSKPPAQTLGRAPIPYVK